MISLSVVLFTLGSLSSTTPPHVLLILADDLGYGDPGCYNEESKIPTPHIDRLAREGQRWTDAHSPSSVCTPTRYGLLTGRYAWRTALKKSVLWPWDPPLIREERLTLPELFWRHGYRTHCVGKWHLGWDWPIDQTDYVSDLYDVHTFPPSQRAELAERIDFSRELRGGPLTHGFDSYFGDDVPNFPPYAFIENRGFPIRPTVAKPRGMFGHDGPATPGWDLSIVMPCLAQRAAGLIDEASADSTAPFFLYLPLTAPHTPIAPTLRFQGQSDAGLYGDFVHQVDWVVGEILAALDRNGLTENTLVIFTSDNGSPMRDGTAMSGPIGSVREKYGHDSSGPYRGMKADVWEGGHRVPLVIRWPEKIEAGTTSNHPWVHTDLYRTLASILGSPVPASCAEDSFDQSRLLLGMDDDSPRDHLVHHSGGGVFGIRVGPWKLILGQGSGGFTRFKPPADAPAGQLYRLDEDPSETVNLYREHPEVVERLRARLEQISVNGRSR